MTNSPDRSLICKLKDISSFLLKRDQKTICVQVNDTSFNVMNHWFWRKFKRKNWEPQTYQLMNKYLSPEKNYIDVGTWIGPTILFATEIGAKKIYGVEANPVTYEILSKNSQMNQVVSEKLSLYNLCITDVDGGKVDFGGKKDADASSASSIRGNAWQIPSSTICTWMKKNKINGFNFIKIDIEGAESLIEKDMQILSSQKDLVVLLSLHPPFWENKEEIAETVAGYCSLFDVYTVNEEKLEIDELKEMMLTSVRKPKWGTKYGNFFEVLLKSK